MMPSWQPSRGNKGLWPIFCTSPMTSLRQLPSWLLNQDPLTKSKPSWPWLAFIKVIIKTKFENLSSFTFEVSLIICCHTCHKIMRILISLVTRLTSLLNESLRVTEEDSITSTSSGISTRHPPSINVHIVQEVSTALTAHVTQLMVMPVFIF